ncbi:MAG: PD40 domain-containing protein [Anaerolineae bacterium]|nr:PD40 domain-containing protein [Anaerolineae bacterium]
MHTPKTILTWCSSTLISGLLLAALALAFAVPGATIAQDDPTATPGFVMPTLPPMPTIAPPPMSSIPNLAEAGLPSGYGGGVIAFSSDRDGDEELYLVSANGRELRQLTDSDGQDIFPAFSPDGSRIVFCSDRGGEHDIYLMTLATGEIELLAALPGGDYTPDWSPDGSRIAFVNESNPDSNPVILIVYVATGEIMPLTDGTYASFWPAWSPDGSQIAFVSERDGNADIYVITVDANSGSGEESRLTTDPAVDWNPDWSPDGSRIVFNSDRDGDDDIYTMAADGSDIQQLTDNDVSDWNAAWSPDGTQIAFVSYRSEARGANEIFVMAADGSDVHRVTVNPTHDEAPAWMPEVTPPTTRGTILLIFGRQYIAPIVTTIIPMFEDAGYDVVIASHTLDTLHGKDSNDTRQADLLLEYVNVADYDAVIFSCDNDITFGTMAPLVNMIAQDAVAQDKVVGAICSGPRVLARAEVVADKIVTGEPSSTCQMLDRAGGICTDAGLEQDGNMITARTRDNRREFAEAILATLDTQD